MPQTPQNDQRINIRLPASLAGQARRKAQTEQRPLSEVIRELLRAWLAGKPKP